MIRFLARILMDRPRDYDDPGVRRVYGMLCGAVGIGLNILLFAAKYLAGLLAHSIAITADAFNNLSDLQAVPSVQHCDQGRADRRCQGFHQLHPER